MKLLFVGIQGSGKGTQSKILERNHSFSIFETGGALRTLGREDSELGRRIKETMDSGNLVDINTVGDVIRDYLNKNDLNTNIIFDGIPRTKEQKKLIDSLVSDFKVVLFELPEEEVKKRLLGRMYNLKTGETFISGTKIDPKTGDKLESRKDDNQESIKQRIKLFFKETIPVINEYEDEGKLIKINADQSIEDVSRELIDKLNLK